MKYKIGIFGSSAGGLDKILPIAKKLGKELGKYKDKIILITGAADGLPYETIKEAHKQGSNVWGFSTSVDLKNLKILSPQQDLSLYKKLVYVSKNYEFVREVQVCRKYRNVTSTANCDAGIIISGRWGTMNEFTNLYDMGKIIGILTGTGGIADELPKLIKKISKKTKAVVVFDKSPKLLINKVINILNTLSSRR